MKFPAAPRASQQQCMPVLKNGPDTSAYEPFAWQDELLLPERITKEISEIFQTIP